MVDLILFGDCKETLKQFPRNSAQMCVTSPPYYGLRDYGGEANQIGQEETPEEFIPVSYTHLTLPTNSGV